MIKHLLITLAAALLFIANANAQAADAEVANFTSPVDTNFCPTELPISINIYNNDFNDITEVVLNWTINSVAQLPVTWTGLLSAGDFVPVELTPSFDFVSGNPYDIQVTIQTVNTLPDPNPLNDIGELTFFAYETPEPQFYWDGCGLDCINCEFGSGDYDSIVWVVNGSPDPAGPDFHYYSPVQSGTYSVIGYVHGSGCESTTDSVITISPPTHGITALGITSFCEGDSVGLAFSASVQVFFSWNTGSSDDTIYATSDGWYTVTGVTVNSCPVADSIHITVHPLPVVTITNVNDTLFSDYSGVNQWYWNGSQIPGAHDSIYVPTQSGLYYCTATDIYGCTGTSNTINYIMPGISIPVMTNAAMIFPNPAKDFVSIKMMTAGEKFNFRIMDSIGRTVLAKEISGDEQLDVSGFDDGVYQFVFTNEAKSFTQTIVIN